MKSCIARTGIALMAVISLSACQTNATAQTSNEAPKPAIAFVDLQGFDAELSQSLAAPLPNVQVSFYDKVTPSALPLRLQTWLSSVEAGGGKVKVIPPKSDISAKDPFLLMSLASSLWSASKMAKEMAVKAQFNAAQAYNAELVLKDDGTGQSVIERVVFVRRTP